MYCKVKRHVEMPQRTLKHKLKMQNVKLTQIWKVRNKTLGQHASQNVKSTHQNASKNIKMLVGTSKHESKSKQRIIFQMHFSTLQLLQN